jgi:hypothetical protein
MVNANTTPRADLTYRVIIYGASAWLMGIAWALEAVPNLDVRCLDPRQFPSPLHIITLTPDVVITEHALGGDALHLLLKAPVIEIDAAHNNLTVHSKRDIAIADIENLTRLIEEVAYNAAPRPAADATSGPAQS